MITVETQFACEYCGQSILVDSDAAGHSTLCPTCGRVVTVPSCTRESEDGCGYHGVEQAQALQRIEEPSAETDLAGLRRAWSTIAAERDRLQATAAHQQAEIKSFHNERLGMRSDLAQLRQILVERERQLGEWQGALERLGTERLVLEHDLDSARRQLGGLQQELTVRNGALAGVHRKLARERSVTQGLRDEAAELRGCIEELTSKLTSATGAREALGHTAEKLRLVHEKLRELELEEKRLHAVCAQRDKDVDALRRDLTRTDTGRQLVELRGQLQAAVEEEAHLRTRVEELDALLQKRAHQYKRLEGVLVETRAHFGEALRQAESVSDERLKQDNKILIGIIARQNVDMQLRHRELYRLKRARFSLRAIYGLIVLGLVALAIVALQFVPYSIFEH